MLWQLDTYPFSTEGLSLPVLYIYEPQSGIAFVFPDERDVFHPILLMGLSSFFAKKLNILADARWFFVENKMNGIGFTYPVLEWKMVKQSGHRVATAFTEDTYPAYITGTKIPEWLLHAFVELPGALTKAHARINNGQLTGIR